MKRLGPVVVLLLLTLLLPARTVADAGIDNGTNAHRGSQGLPAVATSALLADLAFARANEIDDVWAHNFWWWDASGCNTIGENLTFSTETHDSQWAVNNWIASSAHRANMLGSWDVMGSSIVYINGGTYAVQLFGRDCGESAPAPAPAPVPPTVETPPNVEQPPATLLPNTSMRSPCQTSRTLCPSLNRMTATCSLCSTPMAAGTSSPE